MDAVRAAEADRKRAARNRRGKRAVKGYQAGSARLRPAGEAFDDAPLPSLRLKPPPEPPEAAL